MRVFLGNGPWSAPGTYGVRAGSRWPHFEKDEHEYMPFPFFLAYTAAVLEAERFDVLLVDALAEKLSADRFLDRMAVFDPDLVILEASTPSIQTDLELARKAKGHMPRPFMLAFAGLHSGMYDPSFLEAHPQVDFVLIGEYELTALELSRALSTGDAVGPIPGLIGRDDSGVARSGGRRQLLSDLDQLPWPARHQLPLLNYHDEPGNIPRPSVQMLASRGCPYGCSFCAWPQIIYGGSNYRVRSPKAVVDEMEWLEQEWGFESVYFDDDTFNIGKPRILEFCSEISRRHLRLPWAMMGRADLVDEESMQAMVQAGLHAVKYGVESVHQGLLDDCGKALDLDKVRRGIEITRSFGVKYHLTFMFGLPGETRETALRTIDFALESGAESAQFTLATPFPGSRFHEEMDRAGRLLCRDFTRYDGATSAVIRTEALSGPALEDIVRQARTRWRARPLPPRPAPLVEPRGPQPRISFIVPHHSGEEHLARCLDSLFEQRYPNKEVILVNSGVKDGSATTIEHRFPDINVVHLEENLGFAGAANRGIQAASGTLVALVNDDVWLEPDWSSHMARGLANHPQVGSCASLVLRADDPNVIDSAGLGLTRLGHSFNLRCGASASDRGDTRAVFGPCAAAALYRRSLFDSIGLFDERFGSYLEDVDLALRAQLQGLECVFVPHALAYHVGAATSGGQFSPYMVEHVAQNTISLMLKGMPRGLLKRHAARAMLYQLACAGYHLWISRQGAAFLRGVRSGLEEARIMIDDRKRVLGPRRVDDRRFEELLVECECELERLAVAPTKRAALAFLHPFGPGVLAGGMGDG